ncbi:hypothetical protein JW921_03975 [Candidatus Fermentibacterales bacterium]|nr:hypothetical protein [Candidatus Fermentibacterales bacterium]
MRAGSCLAMLCLAWGALAGSGYYVEECNVAGPVRLVHESQLLEESPGRAFRPDSVTLCLVTDDGDTLVYSDTAGMAESGLGSISTLVDWLPRQRLWVIWRMEWDFSDWLLVSGRDGRTWRAIGRPVASPNGTRLLCAYSDPETAHMNSGLEIWRVGEDGIVQEFLAIEDLRAPTGARWLSDSLIAYEMMLPRGAASDDRRVRGELRLTSRGAWETSEETVSPSSVTSPVDYGDGPGLVLEYREAEEQLLEHPGCGASRPGPDTLCLVTAAGDTLLFWDRDPIDPPGFECLHWLVDWFPEQGFWAVRQVGPEWLTVMLISCSTGTTSPLISRPVLSPGGTRLLCAYRDLMAGFTDNGVEILRIEGDTVAVEFSDITCVWGPSSARWSGDSLVLLDLVFSGWSNHMLNPWSVPGRIELCENGRWVLTREAGVDR